MRPIRQSGPAGSITHAPTGPEWVGGVVPLPAQVGEGPDSFQPRLALWIERPSDAVVGYELLEPDDPPGRLALVLQQAMERPLVGPPRRPALVRLANADEAALVRGVFGGGLTVQVGPTPELDAVLAHYVAYQGRTQPAEAGSTAPSRNTLCPCGSGKKYKKCHGVGRGVHPKANQQAATAAWLSAWEVSAVTPGTGLSLQDLLTGELRQVTEATASRQLVPGEAIVARVADLPGRAVLAEVHPHALPPLEAAEVVDRMKRRLRRRSSVPVERLRDPAVERYLVSAWEEEVARFREAALRPPELVNTDGDEMLLTVDHFGFEPDARTELITRLAKLEELHAPEPGEPDRAWTFVRAGGNTVLGWIRVERAGLQLETNSTARADRLRARLEGVAGGLLRHRAREQSSPTAPPGLPGRGGSAEKGLRRGGLPPEGEARIVREYLDKHYAEWPDHPLPALGGLTPREAVKTAGGRESVRTLLKSFDHHAARGPGGPAPDTNRLRRELGL